MNEANMPRQPFLNLYKPGMHYAIGAGEISKRPELASLVAQCIDTWTNIELQMSLSLGAILKTNSDTSVAIFLAIKTSSMQRDVLETVAKPLLSGNSLDAFEALLSVYRSLEKQRNALAHGLFGISDALPDSLLWCDIQDHANFLINVYLHEYKGTPLKDPHKQLREVMFVYRLKDLEELLRDLAELHKATFLFHCHHQPREPKHPVNYLDQMLSLRLIKQAVQKLQTDSLKTSDD